MSKEYQYILWDMDGTILDFEASEKAAIKALFEKYGFGQCSDEMVELYSQINKKYWEALERGEMTKTEILIGRFKEFFTVEGLPVDKAENFNADYQLALGDTIVYCSGAQQLVDDVTGNPNFISAVVTNGTLQAQTKKLKLSGLGEKFDYIFISELIGYEKPAPEFFKVVFETMGIEKEKTLIIGDSLTSDITGGVKMGIDSCWYNPKRIPNGKGVVPTYEIHHLDEIRALLKIQTKE